MFNVSFTGVRPILRSVSSIVAMDLLISLEKMLKTIGKQLVMVGIHERSYYERDNVGCLGS